VRGGSEGAEGMVIKTVTEDRCPSETAKRPQIASAVTSIVLSFD